ncbi:coadhesin-like isoform X1 [Crassostrea angulata]|uniref:coadhesin-like isoform X1 n=1 Tax=Magallana angulata TaxID=2784310 RepID=UPI0022B107D7|nr:coadhesin-like isoform X1 [Crassostrea angulata]
MASFLGVLYLLVVIQGSYATVFYTPNAYSYHTVSRYGITCAGKSYVTFKVRACNDAHLALMTYDRDSGPLYEIVIGGWGNGQCCLRKSKQGSCYRTYRGSVLNCGSYQYFWVSWGGSVIRLGRGTTYGSNTLMSLSDSSIRVNYIAVSTGWGSTGYWEFYNPPVHGGWSSWSGYGSCSKSCGSGSQSRSRSCNNPSPAYGGNSCSGSSSSSRSCNTHSCPIHGGWSSWSGYGSCSKSCGSGSQSRSRSCNNPSPAYGGNSCSGSSTSTRSCNTHNCPIHGGWSSWSGYGSCSKSCGSGSQSRSRSCNNPSPAYGGNSCSGSSTSSQSCNTHNCPIHGGWSSWSGYGSCSKSCGSGSQSRSRSCNNPSPAYGGNSCSGSSTSTQSCNTHNCPIDGGWSTWSGYGSCSKTCGTGTQSRSRTCTNPAPAYNGLSCSGSATSSQNCNTHNCPIDGQWATWGSWTTCSVTCGGGSQSRTRTCTNPAPQYNGSPCPNSASSTQACNTHHCPIDGGLSSWGSWGTCTVTCGGGTQDRLRTCTNPAPQYGGALCVGATTNTQDCNTQVCIIDGAWSSWSGYGLCSVSCGGGKQSRSRTCTNPKPANGGLDCPGGASELTDCNVDVCPTVPAGQYQQLCPAGWFTCETGGITCIDEAFQCDCSKDCDDGSDEDATYASCTVTQMASCKSSGGHMTLSIMAAMLPVLGMVLLQIII